MPPSFLSRLTGSFAQPAAENPTGAMVEAAYRHHGIDARYINCEVTPRDLRDAVRGARAMGWVGFNCSLPHKVAILEHVDELHPSAQIIGAVNCVMAREGRWIGANTDGQGFLRALRTVIDPVEAAMVILGAGGAARAIAVESALAGVSAITIVNRDPGRGERVAAVINERTPASAAYLPWEGDLSVPPEADILVNATPVGLFPDLDARLALQVQSLRPGLVVADVIPNPPATRLLADAQARGATTLDGLGMLVNQGVISIRHWLGVEVDPGVMREAVHALLGG